MTLARQSRHELPFSREPLLRPEDAAELLSVEVSWIYEACRTGRLPFLRVGKHLRFTRSELERWLDSQRVGGGPQTP